MLEDYSDRHRPVLGEAARLDMQRDAAILLGDARLQHGSSPQNRSIGSSCRRLSGRCDPMRQRIRSAVETRRVSTPHADATLAAAIPPQM